VGANGVVTNSITASAVDYSKVATGFCVQQVNVISGTLANGTTIMPYDNTIPQNTEGDQYMTLSITPKSATNILVIQVVTFISSSVATFLIAALFQDSTANALAAGLNFQSQASGATSVPVTHTMVAGTTSPTTFKLRCGGSDAGTFGFNGVGANQRLGAITKSSMIITEYKA
jgi:hypothetical protein